MRVFTSVLIAVAVAVPCVGAQALLDPRLAVVPFREYAAAANHVEPAYPDLAGTPESALSAFHARRIKQADALAAFTASSLIQATLPSTSQHAELEVMMQYVAPRVLTFTQIRFTGDPFVKRQVIGRLLQSEVDHVAKQKGPQREISSANYTFSYKGRELLNGHFAHIFALKPRRKVPGLFKGDIYVDSFTGSLLRAKGTMVKSPSFFIRRIEFVQEFADIDEFTVPVRLNAVIKTRVFGKVLLQVLTHDYSLSPGAGMALAEPTHNY